MKAVVPHDSPQLVYDIKYFGEGRTLLRVGPGQ